MTTMPRTHRSLAAVALLVVSGGSLLAQGTGTVLLPVPENPTTRVATRGANFLEIGVGARGLAMAGGYTALAEGVTALYWNPAGVAELEGPAAAVSIANLYEDADISHNFVGAVLPLGGAGVFGIALSQLTSGDMQRTTEEYPDGGDPTFGSTFSYKASSAGLYYARRLTDRLSLGVGLKFATEGIDDAKASYVGLDVGTKFRTGLYGTHIAASLSNLGTSGRYHGSAVERFSFDDFRPGATPVEFSTQALQMPTLFRFSVRSDVLGTSDALFGTNDQFNMVAILEATDAIDTDVQTLLGFQMGFRELVYFRAGKRWTNEKDTEFRGFSHGAAVGGGLRLPVGSGRRLSFDYAYTGMSDLQNVQVFSVEFGF
jgi:hypothetical protein